jgi:hypothetical protein
VFAAVLVGLTILWPLQTQGDAQKQAAPTVAIPKPGVPEIMTMEGKFVRIAYNNEGFVVLGYQVANRSIGDEWMLLDVGMTVMEKVPNYTLTRDALSLETPDGKTVALATVTEFQKANQQALERRARIQRDSVNYFPPSASDACRLGFFADLGSSVMPWDQVELSSRRGCLGQIFFRVPGGIAYGQHWLNVKFQKSLVRVPFRILTEDEEKFLSKNYKAIDKQIEEAFKKPR